MDINSILDKYFETPLYFDLTLQYHENKISQTAHQLTNLQLPSKFASKYLDCNLLKWVYDEWVHIIIYM